MYGWIDQLEKKKDTNLIQFVYQSLENIFTMVTNSSGESTLTYTEMQHGIDKHDYVHALETNYKL